MYGFESCAVERASPAHASVRVESGNAGKELRHLLPGFSALAVLTLPTSKSARQRWASNSVKFQFQGFQIAKTTTGKHVKVSHRLQQEAYEQGLPGR